MKNIIGFTFVHLFFLSSFCFAQSTLDLQFTQHYQYTINDIEIQDNRLVLGGGDLFCGVGSVSYLSQEGEILWHRRPFDAYGEVEDILVSSVNNNIYAVAPYYEVDIAVEGPSRKIARLDTAGNVLSVTSISFSNGFEDLLNLDQQEMSMTQLKSGEILLADESDLFWISEEGDSLTTRTYPEASFLELLTWQDSFILALSTDRLYLLDAIGTVLHTEIAPLLFLDIVPTGEDFLILGTEKIYQYNPNEDGFSVLTTLDSNIQAKGLLQQEEQILLWGTQQENNLPSIFRLNTDFSLEDTRSWNVPNTGIQKVLPAFGQLLIAGFKRYVDSPTFDSTLREDFIQLRPFEESLELENTNISLSIEEIETDYTVDDIFIYDYMSGDTTISDTVLTVDNEMVAFKVLITNLGTMPIHSLTLTSQSFASFNCVEARFFKHYSDLNIAPGESLSITDEMAAFYSTLSHQDLTIDIGAISPNCFLDTDFSDNEDSRPVTLVSAPKVISVPEHLQFYPNPFTHEVIIESQEEQIESLLLFDLNGYLIKEVKNLNTQQFGWNMENLASGCYVLKIQTAQGQYAKKLVKN